jgi:hypothetical protein
VPLTGIAIYTDWARSLGAFEESVRRFPALEGAALQRYLPEGATVAIIALAAVAAFVTSGRMALSRFAIVAVAASPTLYVHGFAALLVAALWLDAASFWLVAGILPSLVFFIPDGPAIWGLVAVTGGALLIGLTRAASAKRSPGAMPLADRTAGSALHPLGANHEPWPEMTSNS